VGIKATVTTVHQQTFNKSGIETTQQSLEKKYISSKTELDEHQQNSGCLPSSPPKVGILAIKNWISTCQWDNSTSHWLECRLQSHWHIFHHF